MATIKQESPMGRDNTTGRQARPMSGSLGRECAKARENGPGKVEMNILVITAPTAKTDGESFAGLMATCIAVNSARI